MIIKTKTYSAPTIQRLGAEPYNPFRMGNAPRCAEIDGVPIPDLVRRFGSPLFVFSEQNLRSKYREAKRAFELRYPDIQFAWSYKTNYLNAICQVFHQEGSIAEVVSEFEYDKARQNGIPGNEIIFNGPYKHRAILERAANEGAMIQIDNLDELLLLGEIAMQRTAPVNVALRIYMDTGRCPVWSKFGFNADNGEALRVVRRMVQMKNLRLQGLHSHVGTFILDPEAYRVSATVLVGLALEAEKMGAGPIRYLNLGGGFASRSRLHGQYLPPEQVTPSFEQYAQVICPTIMQLWPTGRPLPKLYFETGRALVDEAGYLVSTVVAVKQRDEPQMVKRHSMGKGGIGHASVVETDTRKAAYVIDAGVNLLYTTAWYQPNMFPVKQAAEMPFSSTVYGCLCMNIDVIREEVPLPSLTTGDQVVMHPVGAYNITQSMQFITYRPAVVMIGTDGEPRLIKRREDLSYVQELEEVPDYLTDSNKVIRMGSKGAAV